MAKASKPTIDDTEKTGDATEDAVVLNEKTDDDPDPKDAQQKSEPDDKEPAEKGPADDVSDAPAEPGVPVRAKRRGGGFLTLLLGGVLAAIIGFTAARYVVPDGWPFPGVKPAVDPVAAAVEDHNGWLSALQTQIDGQAQELNALTADTQLEELQGAIRGEFGTVHTRLQDLSNRLDALNARLSAVEKIPQGSGTEAAEAAAAAYERELAGIRAMLDGELARIAAVQTDAQSLEVNATKAAKAAAGRAALARILAALDTGQPYADALFDLGEVTGAAIPDALTGFSETGVPTLASLQSNFPDTARAALDASIRAAVADGSMSRVTAFLRTQLGTRSLEPREGSDPDAILSRAEAALKSGRIDAALSELTQIPAAGQPALVGWIGQANARVAALKAGEDMARQMNSN